MRLGIIGLPGSGKTTLFNALTGADRPTISRGGRFETYTSIVDVPDQRLAQLVGLFHPKKITHAKITYDDIVGLNGHASEGISGELYNHLSQMDGFLLVVRGFDSQLVPHPYGSVDPLRDLTSMEAELLLNDLIIVERKIDNLKEEVRKAKAGNRSHIEQEISFFERLQTALSDEIPLQDVNLLPEEYKLISGFGFLSRKPVLVALNLGEGQPPTELAYAHQRSKVVTFQGQLEMEIAQLPPEEAPAFLAEYGISESASNGVIHLSYQLLDLISFFTVGSDEVRAWTVKKGSTAFQAAGVIHSDLQKGFIRAEVIGWDELLTLGGLSEARQLGKLRLEGKDYLVRDGEIVHIRFNL